MIAKKSGKLIFVLLSLLQIALIIGYFVFRDAMKKYMGMNRFIAYYNNKIAAAVPRGIFLAALLILLLALILVSLYLFSLKRKNRQTKASGGIFGLYGSLLHVLNAALCALCAGYALTHDEKAERGYYFILLFYLVFLFAQFLKSLLFLKINDKK